MFTPEEPSLANTSPTDNFMSDIFFMLLDEEGRPNKKLHPLANTSPTDNFMLEIFSTMSDEEGAGMCPG